MSTVAGCWVVRVHSKEWISRGRLDTVKCELSEKRKGWLKFSWRRSFVNAEITGSDSGKRRCTSSTGDSRRRHYVPRGLSGETRQRPLLPQE